MFSTLPNTRISLEKEPPGKLGHVNSIQLACKYTINFCKQASKYAWINDAISRNLLFVTTYAKFSINQVLKCDSFFALWESLNLPK